MVIYGNGRCRSNGETLYCLNLNIALTIDKINVFVLHYVLSASTSASADANLQLDTVSIHKSAILDHYAFTLITEPVNTYTGIFHCKFVLPISILSLVYTIPGCHSEVHTV